MLRAAAAGRFPPADLAVEVVGPPGGRSDAVVAFSGHSVIAAQIDPAEVQAQLPDDDPGAPMSARFLSWLGDRLGTEPGSLDVVLATERVESDGGLRPASGVEAHARVARALRYRDDVQVFTDPDRRGVVIVGRGLAGRLEVSIEVAPGERGRGRGALLAHAARSLVAADEPLFAQVAPGNASSLRAFLAAGYRPIGAEVLFLRRAGFEDRTTGR